MQLHRKGLGVHQEPPESRHGLITDAVLTIAAEEGLGHATLRSVARTAEVSMGMVQHHFVSTERMLHDSLISGLADMRALIDARTAQALLADEPPTVVKIIAQAHLEDSAAVVRLLRAIAQFRVTSPHNHTARAAIADHEAHYTALIAQALATARRRRLLHRLVEPDHEAALFWAVINTLGTDVALGLRERDEAHDLLRYHFLRLAKNTRVTRPRSDR